jgi:hypothetical protein
VPVSCWPTIVPSQHTVEVPLRGGIIKKMPVEIAYTHHCYSRTPRSDINEQIPEGHRVMDGGKQRMFCERRNRLPLNLQTIMDELIRSANLVCSVELVEEEADVTVTKVTYYVPMQSQGRVKTADPRGCDLRRNYAEETIQSI